jgi:ABC-type nitrate/sulfonate/bicarbonate transport system ATPase subunit
MTGPLIRTSSLSVSYGDFQALDKVDFECFDGEFVSIVGKSGTGKSSFLNALAGFIAYEGSVVAPSSIGYVFQDYALFPWMRVEENIAFGLAHLAKPQRRERVLEMLERIEMSEFSRRYPPELSGGQIQRVALARALAPDPTVLLMDEPYGALDHHTRDRMQTWLLSVWEDSKKTVLFVTHYIEEAIFLADRVVVLRDRRFVADLKVPFSRPRKQDLRFSERFLDMKYEVLDYMENGDSA